MTTATSTNNELTRVCDVCGRDSSEVPLLPIGLVREPINRLIEDKVPRRSRGGFICVEDLNKLRVEYVGTLLAAEKGELSTLEKEVLESLREQDTLSRQVEEEFEANLTVGERLSDKMATFGGSWPFVILFALIVILWMTINLSFLSSHPFDPYPFILLNLVLSCLAAIQAPIIMMSQNRQEARDRLRAIRDYQVNLKAELEIRHLHQKIDHMLSRQWERLVEIQEIQLDLIHGLENRNVLSPLSP
jgi:uncharacterized membrane protein